VGAGELPGGPAPGAEQLNPFGTPDQQLAAVDRWRQVLDGMVAVGDLRRSEADAIYASDLLKKIVAARKSQPAAHSALTAHFVDYIEHYVKQRYGEQALYEEVSRSRRRSTSRLKPSRTSRSRRG